MQLLRCSRWFLGVWVLSTVYKVFWGAVNSCCEVDGVFLVIVRGF